MLLEVGGAGDRYQHVDYVALSERIVMPHKKLFS